MASSQSESNDGASSPIGSQAPGAHPQGDGELFAEVAVEGGVPWLAEALERHLSFWSGAAPPAAVCR